MQNSINLSLNHLWIIAVSMPHRKNSLKLTFLITAWIVNPTLLKYCVFLFLITIEITIWTTLKSEQLQNLNNSKIWTTFLVQNAYTWSIFNVQFFIGYDTCLSNCCLRIVVCFCNISCISASQCPPKLYVLSHTYVINKQNELK